MAYNNGFPMTYQPYFPAQQPVNPVQQSNSIIWVQGEAGAKSYLVAPNNTIQLWDSEAQTIYLKSADASGMPTMKILDYTIREQGSPNIPTVISDDRNYITRQEFEEFVNKVENHFADIGKKAKGGTQDE